MIDSVLISFSKETDGVNERIKNLPPYVFCTEGISISFSCEVWAAPLCIALSPSGRAYRLPCFSDERPIRSFFQKSVQMFAVNISDCLSLWFSSVAATRSYPLFVLCVGYFSALII